MLSFSLSSSLMALGSLSMAKSQSLSNALLLISSSSLAQPCLDHADTGNVHLIAVDVYTHEGYDLGLIGHNE